MRAASLIGRIGDAVSRALETLGSSALHDRLAGWPCDVRRFEDLQALWDRAADCFGRVDGWINNAGAVYLQRKACKQAQERIQAVIETNLLGAIFGSKVAPRGMLRQGHGARCDVECVGSDGR
jgi:NAD(P)-dependent dehydrogenase (short-subunit alcohol dehydrogenase family)